MSNERHRAYIADNFSAAALTTSNLILNLSSVFNLVLINK